MARDFGDASELSEVTSDYLVRIVDNPNSEYPVDKLIPGTDMGSASAISVLDTGNYFTGTNVETVLAELPAKFAPPGLPAFAPLKAALAAGVSTGFGVLGDSTGNASTEWVALFGAHLAAMYPTYTVNHWTFNTSTQSFDPPTVIQTGAEGERWAVFSSGDALSFPDSAITSPTGDLEIIVRVALNDWTPVAEQVLVSKFGGGGQRTFRFYVDSLNGGRPSFQWSADGTTLISANCPAGQGWSTPADGSALWLRVTLDVDNGASGNTVTYCTATIYGAWTQVGQVITAGTTSLFDSTTALQVGVRGGVGAEGATMSGKVGHVEIRNGLAGELVAPVLPELWQQTLASTVTLTGAPVLSIVNGSGSGYAITDLNETTRVKKLTPDFGQAVTIVSCSHNDYYCSGAAYLTDFTTLKSRVDVRLPLSTLAVTTQNPRTSPAAYVTIHARRASEQVGWARRNNAGIIDAHAAFATSTTPIADLVQPSDGVHPTDAGSVLWAAVMARSFGASAA